MTTHKKENFKYENAIWLTIWAVITYAPFLYHVMKNSDTPILTAAPAALVAGTLFGLPLAYIIKTIRAWYSEALDTFRNT